MLSERLSIKTSGFFTSSEASGRVGRPCGPSGDARAVGGPGTERQENRKDLHHQRSSWRFPFFHPRKGPERNVKHSARPLSLSVALRPGQAGADGRKGIPPYVSPSHVNLPVTRRKIHPNKVKMELRYSRTTRARESTGKNFPFFLFCCPAPLMDGQTRFFTSLFSESVVVRVLLCVYCRTSGNKIRTSQILAGHRTLENQKLNEKGRPVERNLNFRKRGDC